MRRASRSLSSKVRVTSGTGLPGSPDFFIFGGLRVGFPTNLMTPVARKVGVQWDGRVSVSPASVVAIGEALFSLTGAHLPVRRPSGGG